VPWWTWLALGFFVLVVLFGALVVLVHLLRMRRLRSASSGVILALDELTQKTEELDRRLEHAAERAALVEERIAHLNASVDRLSVLGWALGDVTRAVSQVRSAVTLKK
jgi:hypothetical protein